MECFTITETDVGLVKSSLEPVYGAFLVPFGLWGGAEEL